MAVTNDRIEQFRKMAEADPENELGHFSLGRAYLDAAMYAEATESFRRVVQLNANLSKAYHLMAQALLAAGQRQEAIDQLTLGVKIADARGDMMPRNEMLKMLRELGAAVPESKSADAAAQPLGEDQVQCSRCGHAGKRQSRQPFRTPQGKMIYDNVCGECWREWIKMGTKVINELRLPLADPRAQAEYDKHMLEFLNLLGQTPKV